MGFEREKGKKEKRKKGPLKPKLRKNTPKIFSKENSSISPS